MNKLFAALFIALLFVFPALAAVDLNTASEAELQTINGIGPAKAKAIVEYRQKSGGFKSVDDLDNVKGFGKKTVDKIRKDIAVGNAKAAAAGKTSDIKTVKDDAAKAEKKAAKEEMKLEKKSDKK